MTKMTRRTFIAGSAAVSAIALGQFNRPLRAQSGNVVNLYSARHYDTDNDIYQSFTDSTGIRVNLVEAEADQLIERIKSEGVNSPADILMTVDAGRLWRAQEEGLFERVSSPVLTREIPESLRQPEGLWFGLSKRARPIMYSKERVNPSDLSTYEDLVNSQWRRKILIRSSSNIYNQSLVGALLNAHGEAKTEEWCRGMVANFARPPEGNDTAQIKGVAAGQGDIAIANTYYLVRLAKSDKPEDREVAEKVGIFFPNQGAGERGTHINISGGGVLKTAPNKEAAIKFLEHLVSRPVQELFAEGNNEYPVVEGVELDPVLASYGTDFKQDDINAAIYGRLNAEALRVMDRAGWK
ncbi:MAG: Fe(3+) ABC transporter substrate-binding protein [Geitlerinemataceae cyanobacterium]